MVKAAHPSPPGVRMSRLIVPAALLLTAALAVATDPRPKPDEIKHLVEKLGDPEFYEREAATKRLEALGTAAIEHLRAACTSENPEAARRAQELVRKAERRAVNEKALAPTEVDLDATNRPLDAVLADLSKQAKCDVVLGGLTPADLAARKVTVSTNGKVPFWNAVLKVCDAADLQVSSVGGFLAPGAMPYLGLPKPGARVAPPARAVVLEARGDAKRRPAAVYGAVLVEAVPFPSATPDQPSALLQAWPEPRLQWQGTTAAKVTKATDAAGAKLNAFGADPPLPDPRPTADGFTVVRNPNGTAGFVGRSGGRFQAGGAFTPNARQGLVRVKADGPPPAAVGELGVSLFGTVRTGIEPLSRAGELIPNKSAAGAGVAGVDLVMSYRPDGRKFVAEVTLSYDPKTAHPAGVGDDLPGTRGSGAGFGNHTVYGVRVTDAEGKPYVLGLSSGANQIDPGTRRVVMKLSLELHPDKDGHGPPATVTFWGTHARPVEVPVTLKDVPLTGGK